MIGDLDFRALVAAGDHVTTSYDTGPYRVEAIHNYGGEERWSLLCCDLDDPPGTKPHIFLNYCFVRDGRIFKRGGEDEVFVQRQPGAQLALFGGVR